MANRKRGNFILPEELKTDEKLSTKKELAQRRSIPSCPPVPNKLGRKSILACNGALDKPKPVYFSNTVELSPVYNPNLNCSYFQQLYPSHCLIGEGSFGKVYRAWSAHDKQQYAIKKLKTTISYPDRYAEIRNNEKVGVHPNCVQFFMAWEEGCEVFMLLEACQMSLSDYACRNSEIPEDMLWDVLYDMCQALQYLHKRNLLHLDVKPGNIMMKNGYYKLADFGILVDLSLTPSSCKSTLSDGDSKYLAIEVLEGIYTPYCDIFGLGITLLELATDLELPGHGALWQQLRHEILPQTFYDRVSLGLKVIIERMLKYEYEKRPTADKILKFSALRAIEKRDKKQSRINYAAEILNNRQNMDKDNNNVISTPPCAFDSYKSFETSRICLSPKTLFHDDKKQRILTVEEYFSTPKGTGSLNSSKDTDSSSLALALHDSLGFENTPMETDDLKLDDTDSFICMMSADQAVTSTPCVKSKLNKKVLTFD